MNRSPEDFADEHLEDVHLDESPNGGGNGQDRDPHRTAFLNELTRKLTDAHCRDIISDGAYEVICKAIDACKWTRPSLPPWYFDLRTDHQGRVIPDLRNVLIALRAEASLTDAFTFDQTAQVPMLMKPVALAPGAKPAPPPSRPMSDDDLSRLQEWLQHSGLSNVRRDIVEQAVAQHAKESSPEGLQLKLTPFAEIKMSTAPTDLVEGVIPKGDFVLVWGPPKCGKSFVFLDISLHVALGLDYHGLRVQGGPVVYLALEGGGGFGRRVEAWRRRHADDLAGRDPPPFFLLNQPLAFAADHPRLIADIRAQTPAPGLVVLDTLNRAFAGGDENKPADMGKMIQAADATRAAFLGCTVLIIHHCGWDDTHPRGHTSLVGANDSQIAVVKDMSGIVTVTVEHVRDGDPAPPFSCQLERVELGLDGEGASLHSCVVQPAQRPPGASISEGKLNPNQKRFLTILTGAVCDAPDEHKTQANIPGGRIAITRMWLKTYCYTKGWFVDEASDSNNRAKLSNMINALAGKSLIGAQGKYVWDARN